MVLDVSVLIQFSVTSSERVPVGLPERIIFLMMEIDPHEGFSKGKAICLAILN